MRTQYVLLLGLLAGCADGTSTVSITIDAQPQISAVSQIGIQVTDVAKGRDAQPLTWTPAQTPTTIPPILHLALVFDASVHGDVKLTLSAVDAMSRPIATASRVVSVVPSQSTSVTITFGESSEGDLGAGLDLGDLAGADLTESRADLTGGITQDLSSASGDLLNADMAHLPPATWHWENPNTIGMTLHGIWGSSKTDVYAVGETGALIHSTNDGVTWTVLNPGTSLYLGGVWGSGPNDVYVVGGSGTILHSSDGGATWQPQSSNTGAGLTGIWGSGPNDIYIVGSSGTILHSVDQGTNWTKTNPTSANLNAVWGTSATNIYIVGNSQTILHSVPGDMGGGVTWATQNSNTTAGTNLLSVWGSDASQVIVGASNGQITRSTDGSTWTAQNPGSPTASYLSITGSGVADIYMVDSNSTIWHSTNGTTWSLGYILTTGAIEPDAVWAAAIGDVIAVGYNGGILRGTSATNWTPLSKDAAASADINMVWESSTGDVFAVTSGKAVLHSNSGTGQWAPLATGTSVGWWGVGGIDADVYAVGDSGTIIYSANRGQAWSSPQTTNTANSIHSVWAARSDDVYAVGDSGTILHSTNQGGTWSSQSANVVGGAITANLSSVWATGVNDVWIAGGDYILHSTDRGATWSIDFQLSGALNYRVWGLPGAIYAVAWGSISQRNPTNGTWGVVQMNPMFDFYVQMWGYSQNDSYVLGGNGGGILYHTVDGVAWTAGPQMLTGHFTAMHGTGSREIYAVGMGGVIMHYY